jgi:hypothetical protein
MNGTVDRSFGYHDYHLHEELASLQPMYLQSEMSFREGHFWTKANRTFWWLSLVASALYLIFVFVGQRAMKNKKAFDLKGLLAAWNLFLAVFSIIGTARLVPHVLYGLTVNHHSYFFCRAASEAYGQGPSGLWVNLFVWSKLVELFDTVFLVLRKKPVSFLHWFHHATVLMYCWHAGQYQMPTGVFFATMNYVVHSIMYFYYFLAAVTKPPRWGKIVTILQIVQMFLGMFVTAYHYYLLKTIPNCDGSFSNLTAAFVMYTAYMLLFMEFFMSRYLASKSRTKTDSVSVSEKRKEE